MSSAEIIVNVLKTLIKKGKAELIDMAKMLNIDIPAEATKSEILSCIVSDYKTRL